MQTDAIHAVLNGAIADAESMISELHTTKRLGENALAASEMVRVGSIDPVGAHQMREAIEQVDRVFPLLNAYIDNLRTYTQTL